MNPFPAYLHEQLEEKLRERRVVVWYDPNREFVTFIEGLVAQGAPDGITDVASPMREATQSAWRTGPDSSHPTVSHGRGEDGSAAGGLVRERPSSKVKQVHVGEISSGLVIFAGSYFALRMDLEPLVSSNWPQPLLVYLPGEKRDQRGSVLMELEKAGLSWEPPMKRLARNVMREMFSDGVIDDMLAPEGLTYCDIVGLLQQRDGRHGSLLSVVFGTSDNVAAVAEWVADVALDQTLPLKGATPELLKLVENRAGFKGLSESDLAGGRQKFSRYLLLAEFREDLRCEPPATIAMIPCPAVKEQREFCRKVLDHLRTRHTTVFEKMADAVEHEFGLGEAGLAAKDLGSIDTFRFEERAMLRHCGDVLARGSYEDYEEAAKLVVVHSGSFWACLNFSLRQAQWEVCHLLASLGAETVKVGAEMDKLSPVTSARDMVRRYVAPGGWHRMDFLHRRLEARVARMEEEPETDLALNVIRAKVESVLRSMGDRFGQALEKDKWSIADTLHQTKIWATKVAPLVGKVAVFHVDALRYEMGIDLAGQLPEAKDLKLEAAIGVLPSITPLGMAALLPGAAESYAVVEAGGKFGAQVDGQLLTDIKGRMDHLKARVPDATDITLERLLQESPSKVQQRIGNARLLVVRSQELDALGEKNELLARNLMDTVIGNLARAVRRLAGFGFERFVITADHGHQFSARKDDDMKLSAPSGATVELHRRCWIGRGVSVPSGAVAVKSPELGYDSNLEFAFPKGLGVFMSGGGLAYHHGAFSLQELVIPVITFRMKETGSESTGAQVRLVDFPDSITNRTFGVKLEVEADLVSTEPLQLRVVLVSGGEEVGRAGMVIGGEFNRETGVVSLPNGTAASIAMLLSRDDMATVRVVVQEARSGSVLAESKVIPVQLKS